MSDRRTREKWQIEHEQALLMHYSPLLKQTTHQVKERDSDTYSLIFRNEERSCELQAEGNDVLSCNFFWDDTTIFKTMEPVSDTLAGLITAWVKGKVMPSVLQQRYPDLSFGIIAEYYEKGKGIEGEFLDSWDRIRLFASHHPYYEKETLPFVGKMETIIHVMRNKGFDHLLRASYSRPTVMLSRSRRHGLRDEQAYLRITLDNDLQTMTVCNAKESHTFEKIEYNDTMDRLLQELAVRPID